MLLGCEKLLREAHNGDWTMIVREIGYKDTVYCNTHVNFQTSLPIHEPFEQLCEKLGATELQPNCPHCGKVYHREATEANVCKACKTVFNAKGERV